MSTSWLELTWEAACASFVLIKSKEYPYNVSSVLTWLSELKHSKLIIQSDGEPSCAWYSHKGAMMENTPCEIIQQHAQRSSHQSSGAAERMVRTKRNQIKAYKIQIEKNSGITVKDKQSSAHMVTTTRDMAIHAIPQTTRLNNHNIREDSTQVLPKTQSHLWRGSCVQTTRSPGEQLGISMA